MNNESEHNYSPYNYRDSQSSPFHSPSKLYDYLSIQQSFSDSNNNFNQALQNKEYSSVMLQTSQLSKLKPDEWRNIPQCIVQAMKLIIETNEINEQTIKSINSKTEQVRHRINTQQQRAEKEQMRRDDYIRSEIRSSELAIKSDIDLRFQEVANCIETKQNQINHLSSNFQTSIENLNVKIMEILSEQDQQKAQNEQFVETFIKERMSQELSLINQQIKTLYQELSIGSSKDQPDITTNKPNQNTQDPTSSSASSFKTFCIQELNSLATSLKNLEQATEKNMTKLEFMSLMKLEQNQMLKIRQDIDQMLASGIQTEIKRIASQMEILEQNVKTNIQPIMNELQVKVAIDMQDRDLKVQKEHQETEDKLKNQLAKLKKKLMESIQEQEKNLEIRISEFQKRITHDIKADLMEYKDKATEIVEQKCFNLDAKIEQIQQYIESAHDQETISAFNGGINLDHKNSLSESMNNFKAQNTQVNNLDRNQIGISFEQVPKARGSDNIESLQAIQKLSDNMNLTPQYNLNKRFTSKMNTKEYPDGVKSARGSSNNQMNSVKSDIQLIKSTNKYIEMKERIDNIERQIAIILDGQYQAARVNLLSTNIQQNDYKALKDYQQGVKKLLDEKMMMDSRKNLKQLITQQSFHMEKLDKSLDLQTNYVDDETFNKLWKRPESGFQKFKNKRQNSTNHDLSSSFQTKKLDPVFSNFTSQNQIGLDLDQSQEKVAQIVTKVNVNNQSVAKNYQGKSLGQINQMKIFNVTNLNDKVHLQLNESKPKTSQNQKRSKINELYTNEQFKDIDQRIIQARNNSSKNRTQAHTPISNHRKLLYKIKQQNQKYHQLIIISFDQEAQMNFDSKNYPKKDSLVTNKRTGNQIIEIKYEMLGGFQ